MYTETGRNILVQHLRRKAPLTLHLDATGNVARKVPSQTKIFLYYAITLRGGGQNAPPLPVCEKLFFVIHTCIHTFIHTLICSLSLWVPFF